MVATTVTRGASVVRRVLSLSCQENTSYTSRGTASPIDIASLRSVSESYSHERADVEDHAPTKEARGDFSADTDGSLILCDPSAPTADATGHDALCICARFACVPSAHKFANRVTRSLPDQARIGPPWLGWPWTVTREHPLIVTRQKRTKRPTAHKTPEEKKKTRPARLRQGRRRETATVTPTAPKGGPVRAHPPPPRRHLSASCHILSGNYQKPMLGYILYFV
ncbi:hypothetical protein pdul_cds_1071 [Pandoravirus dulcis]|uniref:Uncharacterized protein n=1 Tax=Pandoravirus dulcis TaxID=1349409 RepID=S4VZT6_9VIRU|nr:hypothetical protein pdul_cds_1071 [Pandoravirus dulcis]AGO83354.2 hypothetical protein pdul_cds_1071 [Pandoravirus dulcis]